MTRYGMALLAVGLVLVISQAKADDKEDKAKLQGEWKLVSQEIDEDSSLKFEGDKWHYTEHLGGTFTVDSSKKPKTIDFALNKSGGKCEGKVLKGLYELDGDKLKICIPPLVEVLINVTGPPQRPAKFKAKDNVVVLTYKRVKK